MSKAPSSDELKALFHYSEADGQLWWRQADRKKRTDEPAGDINVQGYRRIGVNGRRYMAHRLIWIIHHGMDVPPNMTIDHINRDKTDNRIINLRLADRYLQNQNRVLSTSPMRFIFRSQKGCKRWRINIRRNWKYVQFPSFVCLGEALKARNAYERATGLARG